MKQNFVYSGDAEEYTVGVSTPFIMTARHLIEGSEEDFAAGKLTEFTYPQKATRKTIRKGFRTDSRQYEIAIHAPVPGEIIFKYRDGRDGKQTALVYHNPDIKLIRFGCRTFSGAQYTKLRRWAMRKP